MFKVFSYKNGARDPLKFTYYPKDLVKGGKVACSPVSLGPKDPTDPTGKRRLDVDDKDKEHFVVIKIYSANPALKPNYKGEMEPEPVASPWVPVDIFQEELRYYELVLGLEDSH